MVRSSNLQELTCIFKESLQEVAKILKKEPWRIKRDEYCRTCLENKIVYLHKDNLFQIGGYRNALNLFFPKPIIIKENREKKDEILVEKDSIIEVFSDYIKELNRIPSLEEFVTYSMIDRRTIRKHFNSIIELFNETAEKNKEIKKLVFNETSFTEDYNTVFRKEVKKYKRFVITTAVSGKKVHEGFYKTLQNYAKRQKALTLILPCEDVCNRKSPCQWDLDPKLRDLGYVVFKDTYLNNNIFISDIKVSAKFLLPTRGLSRLGQGRGSMVLASPKQFLEFVPTGNNKVPIAIMSTGAITVNNYETDFYMSKRLSKLADQDHKVSAVVVEVEDEEIFHFRQIQYIEESESFCDINTEYFSDGSIEYLEDSVMVFGDSHASEKDDEVHEIMKEIVYETNTNSVLLHDLFEGGSISHHTYSKPIIRATNAINGVGSLEKECIQTAEYLEDVGSWIDGEVVVIRSNHDAFLTRYIEDGRFLNDAQNCYYALDICKAYMEGKNPLQYTLEEKVGLSDNISMRWLDFDEDYCVKGWQCANHGFLGPNGARGSAVNIEKCYPKAIIGHSHSPRIHRNVVQTGTLSKLRMGYNHGPSTWLNSSAIIYRNGSVSLINILKKPNGEYSWKI